MYKTKHVFDKNVFGPSYRANPLGKYNRRLYNLYEKNQYVENETTTFKDIV